MTSEESLLAMGQDRQEAGESHREETIDLNKEVKKLR